MTNNQVQDFKKNKIIPKRLIMIQKVSYYNKKVLESTFKISKLDLVKSKKKMKIIKMIFHSKHHNLTNQIIRYNNIINSNHTNRII